MHGEFWFQAFVYLCAAVISVGIATRTGLGSVLGYLLAGVAIGPFGLGLVGQESEEVLHFAEFGVVMMLFLIGLELQPSLLWRMRGPILGLGGSQVLITAIAITVVGIALGLGLPAAIAVGMILSLSSTAIVLQTLAEKGLMKTPAGQSSFAVLLFQDIAVIPMLAVLPLLAVDAGSSDLSLDDHGHGGWQQALLVTGAVAAVIVGGRFLSKPVFRFIARARLREVFTAAALLLVIGISLAMSAVGLSPALGAFLAGVVLANNEYRHELEADIEPFKGLLLGLFFISVGAGIDFDLLLGNPLGIAGLVALLVALKLVVLVVLGRAWKMAASERFLFTFALAQGGEFAFVLFTFANQNGVLGTDVTDPLIATVALSMLLTPVLMIVEERALRPRFAKTSGGREVPAAEPSIDHLENPVIIAGFGRFGHIIGRFLRANGVGTTVLDLDPDQIAMLERLGLRTYYGDASRTDLLEAAGAAHAKLLVIAVDEPDKVVEIAERARHAFPHLKIFARARGRLEAYRLLALGIDHVYREHLGSSLSLGIDALRELGFRGYEAHRAAAMFRDHDEAAVRELAAHADGDRATYFSKARARIELFEKALKNDRERFGKRADTGWDPPAPGARD